MSDKNLSQQIQSIWKLAKRYCLLQINYAKLTFAEKLAVLLGGIAVAAVCLVLASILVMLLSFAAIDALQSVMSPCWAYLTVSAVFIFIILIVIIFRKTLIVNPIAKFISKLFFDKEL